MPAARAKRATFDGSTQRRRSIYAKAQIAKKQLRMSEDDYRAIIFEISKGQTSLSKCTDQQLDLILEKLVQLGFTPLPKRGSKAAQHPMARKARALWISLHHLGAVHNPSEQALEAFACKQLGCEKLVWARQSDAFKLIEALKAMAVRAGWFQTYQAGPKQGKQLAPRELQAHLCEVILGKLKRAGAVPNDWHLEDASFRLCGISLEQAEPVTADQFATLAKTLGDKLRALPRSGGGV